MAIPGKKEQKIGTLGIGLQNKAGIMYPVVLPPRNP